MSSENATIFEKPFRSSQLQRIIRSLLEKLFSKESLDGEVEDEEDSLRMPKYFNYLAQIIFALLFIIFIIAFWSVALSNYLAGPEAFLDTALY